MSIGCRRSSTRTTSTFIDPAAEHYEDYYAVYFLDPDGIKLEGMTFEHRHLYGARSKEND
jgi:hypothetical protein